MPAPKQTWPLWVEERVREGQSQKLGVGASAYLVVIIIQAGVLALQLNLLHSYHPVLVFSGHEVSIGVLLRRPRLLGWDTSGQQKYPFRPALP